MKLLNKNIKYYAAIAAFGLIASCKPTINIDEPASNTQVDFSKYIAIGNSLTAGYSNGGLYLSGQQNSFPNFIAEKMKRFGGGEFITPYFSEEQRNGSGYIRLKALINGAPVTESVTTNLAIRGFNEAGAALYTRYTGTDINNLGVPGMRIDMAFANGVGSVAGNPYFERLLPENAPLTTTYFDYSTSKNHTFFSFALGNNDVLGYATNGAYTDSPTNTLTSIPLFTQLYTNYINTLTTNNQKGVVATIPDVTETPFLNTVTTQLLEQGVTASTGGVFTKIWISTANGAREATSADLFALTFDTDTLGKAVVFGNPRTAGYGLLESNPLHDKHVLDKDEVLEVKNTINAYNAAIKNIADSKGLAIADVYDFMNKVKVGYNYNGIAISNKYITGNAFSLDGIHLTPMGYAIMANIFIDAINAKYNTALEKVDATQYPAVLIP